MKRVLLWILTLLALGVFALVAAGCGLYSSAQVSTVGELGFENELTIPPLLEPQEEDGRKVFDLTLQQGRAELLPGKPAETWGLNGSYLGPTLRAERGDRVELRVRNELPEVTTVHGQGSPPPAAADGGPHQPIEPGETWTPSWEIDQPAATLWYHPHPHGETADHVYRGVAGLFLLDDPESSGLALPDDYGVDDIPVIIQDKRLHDDGSLDFSQRLISPTGRLGDTILVNGTPTCSTVTSFNTRTGDDGPVQSSLTDNEGSRVVLLTNREEKRCHTRPCAGSSGPCDQATAIRRR